MNLRRKSFFVTTALCTLAFLFGTSGAMFAQNAFRTHYTSGKGPVIGTMFSKTPVKVDGKTVAAAASSTGALIKNCSVIKTGSKPAIIKLNRGGWITINPNSIVQVCIDHDGEPVRLTTTEGGGQVRNLDNKRPEQWLSEMTEWLAEEGVTGAESLPYLAAFGTGNLSFPSIGGGGSSSAGGVVTRSTP